MESKTSGGNCSIIQVPGLSQGELEVEGEKWWDSGYVLETELPQLADKLGVGGKREKNWGSFWGLGLGNINFLFVAAIIYFKKT